MCLALLCLHTLRQEKFARLPCELPFEGHSDWRSALETRSRNQMPNTNSAAAFDCVFLFLSALFSFLAFLLLSTDIRLLFCPLPSWLAGAGCCLWTSWTCFDVSETELASNINIFSFLFLLNSRKFRVLSCWRGIFATAKDIRITSMMCFPTAARREEHKKKSEICSSPYLNSNLWSTALLH